MLFYLKPDLVLCDQATQERGQSWKRRVAGGQGQAQKPAEADIDPVQESLHFGFAAWLTLSRDLLYKQCQAPTKLEKQ